MDALPRSLRQFLDFFLEDYRFAPDDVTLLKYLFPLCRPQRNYTASTILFRPGTVVLYKYVKRAHQIFIYSIS